MSTSGGGRVGAKVGVVGVGGVGQACAFALVLRGSCRELVLVDRTAERATAVATDMRYGAPLSPTVDIVGGEWADLAGANITIIEGNDASQFGIGAMCARITEAVLRDERAVLPVAAHRERYGVAIGLPTVVGRQGAAGELEPSMSEQERGAFERSAGTLRDAVRGIGVEA